MEVSLAQENRCSDDCGENEDREGQNGINDTEAISVGSIRTGGGKRNNLRKWFHKAVLGDDVDESIDNEDTILVEDDNDLAFIPTFSELSNSFSLFEKEVSPLPIEQNSDRRNYRRQKLKDFKTHMKIKMHLARNNGFNESGGISFQRHFSLDHNNDEFDNCNEEALDCYKMFKTQPEDLDALFDCTMRNSLEPNSPSKFTVFNDASSSIRELQPFQNLDYDDIKSLEEPTGFGPLDFWDEDQEVNGECSDNVIDTTVSGSCSNVKEEEDCPMLSMDSVEMESSISGALLEKSSQRTPSNYLANELTMENGVKSNEASKDNFNSTEEKPEVSFEVSQDTQNTLCSSGSPDSESSSGSGSSNTIIYTIPTFKQRRGELNVSGIVKSFKDGTLTEKNLRKMARNNTVGVTFRSREFYEQPPLSDEDSAEQTSGEEEVVQSFCCRNDNGNKAPENDGVHFVGNGGGVKFDNYSHILVYRATKRKLRDKGSNYPTLRTSNSQNSLFTINFGESPSNSRPILKKTDNEREAEEKVKATHCDKVDVKSFMNYFDHFEHQKRSEESTLGKVRERQLSHYYSKEFFPELLGDMRFNSTFNSEYRKSKKATEFNIGRKIDDGDEQRVRHLVNSVEGSKQGSLYVK